MERAVTLGDSSRFPGQVTFPKSPFYPQIMSIILKLFFHNCYNSASTSSVYIKVTICGGKIWVSNLLVMRGRLCIEERRNYVAGPPRTLEEAEWQPHRKNKKCGIVLLLEMTTIGCHLRPRPTRAATLPGLLPRAEDQGFLQCPPLWGFSYPFPLLSPFCISTLATCHPNPCLCNSNPLKDKLNQPSMSLLFLCRQSFQVRTPQTLLATYWWAALVG